MVADAERSFFSFLLVELSGSGGIELGMAYSVRNVTRCRR